MFKHYNSTNKYFAENIVVLNPGFKIEAGSTFQTKVSPGCN
ncbi:3-coathanger stack domain-containing protein [Emticicia agri]